MDELEEFEFRARAEAEQATAKAPEESLGSKVLSAIVPSSNEPLPDEVDQRMPVWNPVTKTTDFNLTGKKRQITGVEKAIVGVGRVASDVAEVPKRALGAATGQAEGDTFLKRMADPESGLLRGARKALAQSDAPAALKVLGMIGVGVVEDPLTILAGVVKSAEIMKLNGSAFPNATKAVKVSKDVAEAAAMKGGRKGINTGEVSGVPFSKAQQGALSGAEVTPDLERTAMAEARIKKQNETVWNDFIGDQQSAVSTKVENVKAKHGFSDTPSNELGESVVAKIEDNFAAQKGVYKKKYDDIEKAASETPSFDNTALADAKAAMDELRAYPVETVYDAGGNASRRPKFTTSKIKNGTATVTEEVPRTQTVSVGGQGHTPGQTYTEPVTDMNGKQLIDLEDKRVGTVNFVTEEYTAKNGMDANGVSGKVSGDMMKARRLIDQNPSYQSIKQARSMIGHHIGEIYAGKDGYGWSDLGKLKTSYAKLSAAMEEHILKSGGGAGGNGAQAVIDWKIADKMNSGKGDFGFLRKVLTPGGADAGVQGESVIKRLTNSTNPRNYQALQKIKAMEESGMLTGGVSENLQNALFNDLIEKSSRIVNGRRVVDGELLIKHANSIPPSIYNEVFTGEQADDIAQLVLDGMAQKLSHKIKIIESNPQSAGRLIKEAAGDIGFWSLMKGGPKGWLKWRAGKLLSKALVSRGDRDATRYIRSVDNKSIMSGLFRAGQQSAGLQAGSEALNPSRDQSTPSQE